MSAPKKKSPKPETRQHRCVPEDEQRTDRARAVARARDAVTTDGPHGATGDPSTGIGFRPHETKALSTEELQLVITAVDRATPMMRALTEAMKRFAESAMEAAKYFGLLGKRLHHRGRSGRWQQHLKLGLIEGGYKNTRRGRVAPPKRRRLVAPYVGVGYLAGAIDAVRVADVWQKTMKRLIEQETLPK